MGIEIPRRATKCSCCSEVLKDKYFSSLDKQITRTDYCPSCFEETPREHLWWQGSLPPKIDSATLNPQDQKWLDLFLSAYFENSDDDLLHFLALYLKRRGVMWKRGEEIFELKITGEIFLIPKVEITPEKLVRINGILN